jgi:chemotaxis signal transduction protein
LSGPTQHLIFHAGDRDYAVSAAFAAEVITLPRLTPAPGAPPFVSGVAVIRGEVIPVVELGALSGGPRKARPRGVLVRMPQGLLAFGADRVSALKLVQPGPPDPEAPVPDRYLVQSPQLDGSRLWTVEVALLADFLAHG